MLKPIEIGQIWNKKSSCAVLQIAADVLKADSVSHLQRCKYCFGRSMPGTPFYMCYRRTYVIAILLCLRPVAHKNIVFRAV